MKYYLAYGSNLNVSQMRHRCPTAAVYGTGYIEGYELLYKGSGSGAYLTIEPKEGSRVPVAVWKIEEEDELALDHYEGYPSFYYKRPITLRTISTGGRHWTIDAFAYIMHEDRHCGIPSRYYIETCEVGYVTFNFDFRFLDEALKRSKAEYSKWVKQERMAGRRAI